MNDAVDTLEPKVSGIIRLVMNCSNRWEVLV
jgi:hypothetical protein